MKKNKQVWIRTTTKDGGFFGKSEFKYELVEILGKRTVYGSSRDYDVYLVENNKHEKFEVDDWNVFYIIK